MTNFLSSLCILEISPLSDVGLVKVFFHSVGSHFVLLTVSFALQKLFSFRRAHLLIVSLSVCAAGVRKWSPVPMSSSVLPTFSSIRFSVVGFMLRSLIHLDLNFVHGDRYGSIFILLHQFYFLISECWSQHQWLGDAWKTRGGVGSWAPRSSNAGIWQHPGQQVGNECL